MRMMHTRNAAALRLVLAAAAIALAGCIDYEQELSLNADGSGRFALHYWVKDHLLTQWDDGRALFRDDTVRQRFAGPGRELESVSFDRRDEDSTRHAHVAVLFRAVSDLNGMRGLDEADFRFERRGDTAVFTHVVRAKDNADGMRMSEFSASYALTVPGRLVSHNAMHADHNRLTWRYNLSDFKNDRVMTAAFIVAPVVVTPTFPLTVILAMLGLVALAIGYLAFRLLRRTPRTA
jgi:hypothetical protein